MKKEKEKSDSKFGLIGFILFIASYFPIVGILPYVEIVLMIAGIILSIISIIKNEKLKGFGIAILVIVVGGLLLVKSIGENFNQPKRIMTLRSDITEAELVSQVELENKEETTRILNNEAEVRYEEITQKEYISGKIKASLTVTIKNKTTQKRSFNFTIAIFDKNGQYITNEIIYVNNLRPGKTVTKKIFRNLTDDELNRIQDSTIRIIDASSYSY